MKIFAILFRLCVALSIAWVTVMGAVVISVQLDKQSSSPYFDDYVDPELMSKWDKYVNCRLSLIIDETDSDEKSSTLAYTSTKDSAAKCEREVGYVFSEQEEERIESHIQRERRPKKDSNWILYLVKIPALICIPPALLFGLLYLIRWILVGSRRS